MAIGVSRTLTFSGIKLAATALTAFLAAFLCFFERGLEAFLAAILAFFAAFLAALAYAFLAVFAWILLTALLYFLESFAIFFTLGFKSLDFLSFFTFSLKI